ncbi:MAG TPA: sensor domain-containing diguanylate cyclase [Actinospica sp.]|nr:sensor domain-containing diguanylate cyclase [Actinospica sp.]
MPHIQIRPGAAHGRRMRASVRAALAVGAALAATGVFVLGAAVHWGAGDGAHASHTVSDVMGDFGLAAAAVLAAGSSLRRALQAHGRWRASWLLFAGSALVAGFGNAVWGWYELVLRESPPFPSMADWAFLCFAPFAIAGTLTHQRGLGGPLAWIRLFFDGLLIGGALFTAGWAIALSRDAFSDGHSPVKVAFELGYPVFDIMLVSLVLSLRTKGRGRDGSSMAMLVAGYTVIVVFDALWTMPQIREHYSSGELMDAGWFFGYLLLAIAPWVSTWVEQARHAEPRPEWMTRLDSGIKRVLGVIGMGFPYLAGSTCLAAILADGLRGSHHIHPITLCTACGVLAALAARQALTIVENYRLTKQLTLRENHFRSLVQGASEVIMTLERPGRLGYISPAVRGVLGYEPQQLIGSSLYDLIHVEDRRHVINVVDGFLAGVSPAALVECRVRAARALPLPAGNGSQSIWRHAEATITRHYGGLVFTIRDVSDRVALRNQLAHNAYHDALTGLPNRALFTERLEQAVSQRSAVEHPPAVIFLDLDWFKEVNDAQGHAAGDALLVEAAARLRSGVRAGDTVARFGGDEFAALVHGDREGKAARDVADRLHTALTRPYELATGRFVVGASVGVAYWRPGTGAAHLLRQADLAMYEAKNNGKGRVVVRERVAPRLLPGLPTVPRVRTVRPHAETPGAET